MIAGQALVDISSPRVETFAVPDSRRPTGSVDDIHSLGACIRVHVEHSAAAGHLDRYHAHSSASRKYPDSAKASVRAFTSLLRRFNSAVRFWHLLWSSMNSDSILERLFFGHDANMAYAGSDKLAEMPGHMIRPRQGGVIIIISRRYSEPMFNSGVR